MYNCKALCYNCGYVALEDIEVLSSSADVLEANFIPVQH